MFCIVDVQFWEFSASYTPLKNKRKLVSILWITEGICENLTTPANGGNISCTDHFYEDSLCTFTCPQNYRLRHNNASVTSSTTSCEKLDTNEMRWSFDEPYCEKGLYHLILFSF